MKKEYLSHWKAIDQTISDMVKAEALLTGIPVMCDRRKFDIDSLAILSNDKEKTIDSIGLLWSIKYYETYGLYLIVKLCKYLGGRISYGGKSYGVDFCDGKIILGDRSKEPSKRVLSYVSTDKKLTHKKKRDVWEKMTVTERKRLIIRTCKRLIQDHEERLKRLTENSHK